MLTQVTEAHLVALFFHGDCSSRQDVLQRQDWKLSAPMFRNSNSGSHECCGVWSKEVFALLRSMCFFTGNDSADLRNLVRGFQFLRWMVWYRSGPGIDRKDPAADRLKKKTSPTRVGPRINVEHISKRNKMKQWWKRKQHDVVHRRYLEGCFTR